MYALSHFKSLKQTIKKLSTFLDNTAVERNLNGLVGYSRCGDKIKLIKYLQKSFTWILS